MRAIALVFVTLLLVSCSSPPPAVDSVKVRSSASQPTARAHGSQIHYLEIVTEDVEAVCAAYATANGLDFGEPDALLGHARTAVLADGGIIGVRAPMHESEELVVRPYRLVADIEAAVAAAVAVGGEVAHPPLEIPGRGTFAIFMLGGIQHGLWQL